MVVMKLVTSAEGHALQRGRRGVVREVLQTSGGDAVLAIDPAGENLEATVPAEMVRFLLCDSHEHTYAIADEIYTDEAGKRFKYRDDLQLLYQIGAKGGKLKGKQWVHRYKIAQASSLAKGGIGRKAFKNMMPKMLHMEMLGAAKK